ncbi:MAG TPA: histone deacetylase [Desulfonatronum sp.]|nr:histone deacetylase [Desulfonatronum sp.]
MASRTALLYDPVFAVHDAGAGHPESPMRYTALVRALEDDRETADLPQLEVRSATLPELKYCHGRGYIELVRRRIRDGHRSLGFPDTNVGLGSWDAALNAAGGAMAAVDAVMRGNVRSVFCVLRPPGHHARPKQGMGFCIFNNIALAARHAQIAHGLSRVLIVDWDVHHGNGTQEIFYEDPSVLFFSTHQSNWFPYSGYADETGAGAGEGYTINCPFPAGTDMGPMSKAFREMLLPAAEAFRPELVLISCGFDALDGDPLGAFRLYPEDFAELTEMVLKIAGNNSQGRVVSLLEGGYDLGGMRSAALAHVHVLMTG